MTFTPSRYQPLFTGGHRQTLYTWARRRRFPRLPEPEPRYFDVADDARVLAHCHWQGGRSNRPAIMLLHGLEGSSHSHYMAGIADKAWAAGWNVVRLNQRNCGRTEHLCCGLYHSGLTQDPLFVMREIIERDGIGSIAIAGYSLGGNLALKLAGDLGDAAPAQLAAVCAVSPTMDLARCVGALDGRWNLAYRWNFVRNLKARMRRKAAAFPGVFSLDALRRVRTVRGFDEAYTAPHHGFRDAADYYYRASALRVIDRIQVPTLIITAEDDPFVPAVPFRFPELARNPNITVVITPHGGHCGYVERPGGEYDGYWAEREIMRFAQAQIAARGRTEVPSPILRA